ncbi:hypothetical protein G9A89_015386 [Geosiphon pyriformis]|nr:hypothetical protein G9A89_015386 [Geosiphon pyriformis]
MEEEYLVEETSFDYGEGGALAGGNHDQTPTSSKVKTKKVLDKPLGKIDFSKSSNNDGVLSNTPLELPPSMKNLVNVPVKKSFTLDIGLDKVANKSSQEKLVVVKILFSEINGIIRAMFTSELSLMKATDKAVNAKILVNTNLKKSSGWLDRTVVIKEILIGMLAEAVHTALSEFGVVRAIKMQLIGLWQKTVVDFKQSDQADLVAAEWSILIGKDAARCTVVCFNSAESLNAVVGTMPVLKNANLRWSCLISAKCAKCEKLSYTSLGCVIGGKFSSGNLSRKAFSNTDKSRLAAIYAKRSAPVAHLVSFGDLSWAKVARGSSSFSFSSQNVLLNDGFSLEMKPSLLVMIEVNNRFAALKCSFASLVEQVNKLAKKLDALRSMVSQPSPGCQPLVTPSSQDQRADIVMSEGLGVFTNGETVAGAVFFDMSSVSKLEDSMKCLMETVLGLLAKVDSISVHSVFLPFTQ